MEIERGGVYKYLPYVPCPNWSTRDGSDGLDQHLDRLGY